MADKIYKKLPGVLQTTAIKNFFESTVEQLFSKANIDNVQGYIGSPTSSDVGASGKFLTEPTSIKKSYGLSPVINTINVSSGESENLMFYDELLDTLRVYGVDTKNQNKIFSEGFATYNPPVDADKLLNYQEYYWVTAGPTKINVAGTLANPIDIDADIIGKVNYTPNSGKKFRNGMIVEFTGNFVIPQSKVTTKYIVSGVGSSIKLIEYVNNYNTAFSSAEQSLYNATNIVNAKTDAKVVQDPNTGKYTFASGSLNWAKGSDVSATITAPKDYILQQRGALNNNSWSRVNFWFHRDNFIDAGDSLPDRTSRAVRPIIEFDHELELFNHGVESKGSVTVACHDFTKEQLVGLPEDTSCDGMSLLNATIIFPTESKDIAKHIYIVESTAGALTLRRVGDPATNSANVVDGNALFKPFTFAKNDLIQIQSGTFGVGKEYIWSGIKWTLAQEKTQVNQAPLFNLYDTDGNYLGDEGLFPENNFAGNKIFGFATEAKIASSTLATANDTELGFKLVYKQYVAGSEIVLQNYQYTDSYSYTVLGSSTPTSVIGYHYYKLLKAKPEYHAYMRVSDKLSEQRIVSTYNFSQFNFDASEKHFWIGCVPDVNTSKASGYDIEVKVNNVIRTDFTYGRLEAGYIDFDANNINVGEFIEITARSESGLLKEGTVSNFEIPLSWDRNWLNDDISYITEPEYLPHFKQYIETQDGFVGEPLGSNNFANSKRDNAFATDIVQTNQDIILGSFLIDDQSHNLVDAMRFCGTEYSKYKNRLKSEVNKYYEQLPTDGLSKEYILESVLRNLLAYKVGREVFNRTYIVPFGDNYTEELFAVPNQIRASDRTFVSTSVADLDKLENSLLVYNDTVLLTVDSDYTISSFNPLTVVLAETYTVEAGSNIVLKIYNAERDSAQCPPTPSTMGLYPLFQPEITMDNSYATPIKVVVGHDGSKTMAVGDLRDDVLLEFEKRVYNAAKAEFRQANSVAEYSLHNVRNGAFRQTKYSYNEFHDLMRYYFNNWTTINELDPAINEFYDVNDEWTWNVGDKDLPGGWRGWYEYHYDTIKPHTHPWEMLGFTEKPTWWDEEYSYYAESDITKTTKLVGNYLPANKQLWSDIENGIIRKGNRENVNDNRYLTDNPFRRIGLSDILPIDTTGNKRAPSVIQNTATTTITNTWTTVVGTHAGLQTTSFRDINGLSIRHSADDVFVENLNNKTQTAYTVPKRDLTTVTLSGSTMKDNAVAVMVNGRPLYNPRSELSYNNENVWHYNRIAKGHVHSIDINHYELPTPESIGATEWNTTEHSPIIGWAFDGLPIYGPYGYTELAANGDIVDSAITNIKSSFKIKTGLRESGPGGAFTGSFVEDYDWDSALSSAPGYANKFNMRYGKTPESPTNAIRYYVATIDDSGTPMFPYAVGGDTTTVGTNSVTWANKYYQAGPNVNGIDKITVTEKGGQYTTATVNIADETGTGATATAVITNGAVTSITITASGQKYTNPIITITGDGVRAKASGFVLNSDSSNHTAVIPTTGLTNASISTLTKTYTQPGHVDGIWKFGDNAPVEYVWKSSELYAFAQAEALLVAKPGRFATIFSDPTALVRHKINKKQLFNKTTLKRWKFNNEAQFTIHGDIDADGTFLTNIGYTQFINSWLQFQGLTIETDFVEKLRSLNMKLAHRMSGFIDRDTMVARTDQYSTTGNATSLIIPKENINVSLHSSNYKTRANYSGVIVEKTKYGYRVRGYDKNTGFFNVLESDKNGQRQRVEVGGEPASYTFWEPNITYKKGIIVERGGRYYQAPLTLSQGDVFTQSLWTALPSLPQIGAVRGTLYQETTGIESRVHYNTEFKHDPASDTTAEELLYDFFTSLGRYQQSQGFTFGEFDSSIGELRDWAYAGKQALFWTSGKWEIGNTIELSPSARKVIFNAPRGFIAKINRSDREQFSIVDQTGAVIDPSTCAIVREDNTIEVSPPAGVDIYGCVLYTKEIEHAIVFDNTTAFSDTLYNPLYNQKQHRIKIKANRAANWKGRFVTEGFIIDGNELKPNLDNMAESLGRYHEFGFIPVEKQVYEASRALFGYTEKEYLRELDVLDEQQYEFYRGMVQSKGTAEALSRIGRSSAIVQGNVSVYDEWALKVGDFGDTDSNQNIELKLEKVDFIQNPQQLTLGFPEDVTNIVDTITIYEARQTYITTPIIEITSPTDVNGVQATAVATIDPATKKLNKITVTNAGSGYSSGDATTRIISSNVLVSTNDYTFNVPSADNLSGASSHITFATTNTITLTDNQSANGAIVVSVTGESGNVTPTELVTAINEKAELGGNISARVDAEHTGTAINHTLLVSGKDFTVANGSALGVVDGTYQPTQRFAVQGTAASSLNPTTEDSCVITVNDNVLASSYYSFDAGADQTFSPAQNCPQLDLTSRDMSAGDYTFDTVAGSEQLVHTFTTAIDTNNLAKDPNGKYKFVDVFINDIKVENTTTDYFSEAGVSGSISGTLFTVTATNITFHDVTKLPQAVVTALQNPPEPHEMVDGKQRETYFGLTANDVIRIVEKATIQLDSTFKDDLPNSDINIRVISNEGVITNVRASRNYEITADAKDDDVIFIDIDDSTRFLKKPTGVRQHKLWPTIADVNATGLNTEKYPTLLNAGYVNSANVDFKAFNVGSLPDLFDSQFVVKPRQDSLVHVAVSENSDWNVYKLQNINAGTSYIGKNNAGQTKLFTDTSLFNFLDTNQIGLDNTGQYLDYYLTLENAKSVDNVVVWTNENISQENISKISDFEAPRLIESNIKNVGPLNKFSISSVVPTIGRTVAGLTVTDLADGSDTVMIEGSSTRMRNFVDGDLIKLTDNVGTVTTKPLAYGSLAGQVLTVSPGSVSAIAVNTAGSGYTTTPAVTVTAPSGSFAGGITATATAVISGPVTGITVTNSHDFFNAQINISNEYATTEATFTTDIVGGVDSLDIVHTGLGYSSSTVTPTITHNGGSGLTVSMVGADDVSEAGEVVRVRVLTPGTGYSKLTPPVITFAAPSGGDAVVVEAVIKGTPTVTMLTGGVYTQQPTVKIAGEGIITTATVSAVSVMNGTVTGITVTKEGQGYDSTPVVSIAAPISGVTATATATTATNTTELGNVITAAGGYTNVKVKINGIIDPELLYQSNPTAAELQTINQLNSIIGKYHRLQSFTPSTGTFSIKNAGFNATSLAKLQNMDYSVITYNDYSTGGATPYYAISNVTAGSFTIERSNSASSYPVSAQHYNTAKIILDRNHALEEADSIRVFTPKFSGMFSIDSTPEANSIVIKAPYISGITSGNVVTQGILINTIEPHGISPLYALKDKRIALHFNNPLYYNKVYAVSSVTPDSIIINNHWPVDDRTIHYYEHRTATLSGATPYANGGDTNASTNAIHLLKNAPKLNQLVVTYKSNAEIVPAQFVTMDSANVILSIDTAALPSNTSISADFVIQRQVTRNDNRLPVVTTVDHNKVELNGVSIASDNYNNPQALVKSINRAMDLRRSMTKANTRKGLGLQFSFLKDYRTPVIGNIPASAVPNYGPYVRDARLISNLSNGELTQTSQLTLSDSSEKILDPAFNKGPLKSGPSKGLVYADTKTNIEYSYRPDLRAYLPSKHDVDGAYVDVKLSAVTDFKLLVPEFHTPIRLRELPAVWKASPDVADTYGDQVYSGGQVVKYNSNYYQAIGGINVEYNLTFTTTVGGQLKWKDLGVNPDPTLHEINQGLILTHVPGNGRYGSRVAHPMFKLKTYDMLQTRTVTNPAGGSDITLKAYRLMPNRENVFEVYQLVQNDDNDIYYTLVDKSYPPLIPHDYFETVNSYTDMQGYPHNDYWYTNDMLPSVDGTGKITNVRDPLKARSISSNVQLPPVEPALYFGPTIISEPYAVSGGNSSDPEQNVEGLPKFKVSSKVGAYGNTVYFEVFKPGYNDFFMWTAGLTPGEYKPNVEGPGRLIGRNTNLTDVGYGRGYYAADDVHLSSHYPVEKRLRWDRPMPRFLYSKNFEVVPEFTNYAYTYYLDNLGNPVSSDKSGDEGVTAYNYIPSDNYVSSTDENVINTKFRPEEIFVACFWTEAHTYKNQLTGYAQGNLSNALSGSTYPKPVYQDYDGTVTRVKYIRLSELPKDAQTRRIIPDTGWGGKEWNNIRVDDVRPTFSGTSEDDIWNIFSPVSTTSGSTGDDFESRPVVGGKIDLVNQNDNNVVVNNTGVLAGENVDRVPVTSNGPIMTGAALESLASSCEPLPGPDSVPPTPIDGDSCSRNTTPVHKQVLLDNNSDDWQTFNMPVHLHHADDSDRFNYDADITGTEYGPKVWANTFKIFNDASTNALNNGHTFRVIFNFLAGQDLFNYGSVFIVQSNRVLEDTTDEGIQNFFLDPDTTVRDSTISSGKDPFNNGRQIGRYGVDNLSPVRGTQVSKILVNNNAINQESQYDLHASLVGTVIENDQSFEPLNLEWDIGTVKESNTMRVDTNHIATSSYNYTPSDSNVFDIADVTLQTHPDTGVKGIGFIEERLSCENGQYVTVFIRLDRDANDVAGKTAFQVVAEYITDYNDVFNGPINDPEEGPDCVGTSRAYASGAVVNTWTGRNSFGYFGQHHAKYEDVPFDGSSAGGSKHPSVDNIYFPYGSLPKKGPTGVAYGRGYTQYAKADYPTSMSSRREHSTESEKRASYYKNTKASSRQVTTIARDETMQSYSTKEWKGYFKAPYTGVYTFKGYSDDGLFVWISSRPGASNDQNDLNLPANYNTGGYNFRVGMDDVSGDEYFVEDGYRGSVNGSILSENDFNISKNYHRGNYALRTGWKTNNFRQNKGSTTLQISDTQVYLVKDSYYFSRIIAGNNKGPGFLNLQYNVKVTDSSVTGTTISGFMNFGGRVCQNEAADPGTGTTTGGGVTGGGDNTDTNVTLFGFASEPQAIGFLQCKGLTIQQWITTRGAGSSATKWTADDLRCWSLQGLCPPGTGRVASACQGSSNTGGGGDTSIWNPAPGNNFDVWDYRDQWQQPFDQILTKQPYLDELMYVMGNSVSAGQQPMTGFNFMPSSFKLVEKKKIVNPSKFGFSENIDPNRYVSATHQRISGGFVVPLAKKLQVRPQQSRALESSQIKDQPWARNIQNLDGLNKTTRYVDYDPIKVGSTIYVNGKKVSNVVNKQIPNVNATSDNNRATPTGLVGGLYNGQQIVRGQSAGGMSSIPNTGGTPGDIVGTMQSGVPFISGDTISPTVRTANNNNDTVTFNPPAFDEPSISSAIDSNAVSNNFAETLVEMDIPEQYATFDSQNIRYPNEAIIDITPKVLDPAGRLVPAGPVARAYIRKPTPSITLQSEDLIGIPNGSEIYFNNKKITIRGNDPVDIKSQINCADNGMIADIVPGRGGIGDLLIKSCSSAGFSVANGCGGGTFKQVGDFHVNRGFEQQRNVNTTKSVANNATIIPHSLSNKERLTQLTTANSNDQLKSIKTNVERFSVPTIIYDENNNLRAKTDAAGNPTSEFLYNFDDVAINGLSASEPKNVMLPVVTETTSNISVYSLGGSDYRIGDRLRLVGGTPVTNTKAPVTRICIESAGAGFTNPSNLQVIFNENQTNAKSTGIGAAGVVESLDENGGIAEITLLNGGAGYDIENPPTVTVYDRSPAQFINMPIVDAQYPAYSVVAPDTMISIKHTEPGVNASGIPTEQVTVSTAYYRTTAETTFGQSSNVDINVADFTFNATKPQQLTVSYAGTTLNEGWLQENTYVEFNWSGRTMQFYIPIDNERLQGEALADAPKVINTATSTFTVFDQRFTDASAIATLFNSSTVEIKVKKPWSLSTSATASDNNRATLQPVPNPTLQKIVPVLSAKIGINDEGGFADGYEGLGGPLRVAKFIVTGVDSVGAITTLKIIDRGLYEIFPSDLTYGLPLEYDHAPIGTLAYRATNNSDPLSINDDVRKALLGVGDPFRNNINYGPNHPEYQLKPFSEVVSGGSFFVAKKHPDWNDFPEFYFDGVKYQYYAGSPGAYDPDSYVIVDYKDLGTIADWTGPNAADNLARLASSKGVLLKKQFAIDTTNSSNADTYGKYITPLTVPGGTGAKVFLTAQDVPSCTEKGRAQETLGLPDFVQELNVPEFLAGALNDALVGAGYKPEDLNFNPTLIGDIGTISLDTDLPGIEFSTPTPGLLEKIGIPEGDFNLASLCIEAELENNNADFSSLNQTQQAEATQSLIDSGAFGTFTKDNLPPGFEGNAEDIPDNYGVMVLACVTDVGALPWSRLSETEPYTPPPPGNGYNNSFPYVPPTSGHGGDTPGNIPGFTPGSDPTNPVGQTRNQKPRNNSRLVAPAPNFANMPLNDNNSLFGPGKITTIRELYEYDLATVYGNPVSLPQAVVSEPTNVLVFESKRYNNSNPVQPEQIDVTLGTVGLELEGNAWVDDYNNTGKWAYLENGVVKAQQENLVDVNSINNAILYNNETGNDIKDLYKWDPFKGVVPSIVSNELDYITETDPVSYNNARTMFGQTMIGKVWWDTSSVRYEWYEQGTNKERAENWGKAFPGSSITVCEWIESTATPVNWSGAGAPRWTDRYVTERRQDPQTGEYKLYYYYWIQNRNTVDQRVTNLTGRTLSTETLAKYISNPRGYGLNLISFISDESLTLTNVDQTMDVENNLQINFSRNVLPSSINHKAWKLLREGDNNSALPEHITDKLIDSLSGENAIGQAVPDVRLSEIERYGIAFRPRQTMFKDIAEARRVMVNVLNTTLAKFKLNTQYNGWDSLLPTSRTYIETTNWYAVDRIDPVTNIEIRYNESYKPVFNVSSVSELYRLNNLTDGTVVQVKTKQNPASQLWLYQASKADFKLIASINDTIKIKATAHTDAQNSTLANELRLLLTALKDIVFVNTANWNNLFFELLKYAYMEQRQLNWAFKTSYLYIEKEEDDLIQFTGFRPDNFQKVLDYMNEVKPYSSKIREYKDGKRTPIETIGSQTISDFDKAPYVDKVTGTVRILDDFLQSDANILANDSQYKNYYSISNKSQDPIRKGNTKIVFDRTKWQLTKYDWNPTTTPTNNSIGDNIAMLTQMTKLSVSSNTDITATDRIFKFDQAVQALFVAEVNTYKNDITASANASIVGNATVVTAMVTAGALDRTIALVKDKAGGNFNGELLDGKVFTTALADTEYFSKIESDFGFDTIPWDENTSNDSTVTTDSTYGDVKTVGTGDVEWDSVTQLVSYEGVFDTIKQGNVTLRRNNESYEGFDGVTFQRVLYGEERPEELALLDPLESVILTVTTHPHANGDVSNAKVSPSAREVTYRTHMNLFGDTSHTRIIDRTTSTLSKEFALFGDSITLVDASFLPQVTTITPGKVWVGHELVYYGKKNGNELSALVRGAEGTTIESHAVGTNVYSSETLDQFDGLNPQGNIWLDLGAVYSTPATWDEAVDNTPSDVTDNSWTPSGAWDEIEAGQLTISNAYATVSNVTSTTADVTLASNLSLAVNEGIKITNVSNASYNDVLKVSAINGSVISLTSSFAYGTAGNLDSTNLFVDTANVQVSSFDYASQLTSDNWDAATQLTDSALSLSDRANADFTSASSIMRFLHEL